MSRVRLAHIAAALILVAAASVLGFVGDTGYSLGLGFPGLAALIVWVGLQLADQVEASSTIVIPESELDPALYR